jgi:dTMP kinase
VFSSAVIGCGGFLIAGVAFNVAGITALLIAAVGACAATAYVTGFTMIQEAVSDELRGRTFATLYAVIRLCLLLSLTVSPLLADLSDWVFSLLGSSQHVQLGGFSYSFPGARVALWAGGVLTIMSGIYAKRALSRQSPNHPAFGLVASRGTSSSPEGDPPAEPVDGEPAEVESRPDATTGDENGGSA